MKCSTHAETTAVGIASNVYEQLPLRAICRATRITPQDKWHESSHDASIVVAICTSFMKTSVMFSQRK